MNEKTDNLLAESTVVGCLLITCFVDVDVDALVVGIDSQETSRHLQHRQHTFQLITANTKSPPFSVVEQKCHERTVTDSIFKPSRNTIIANGTSRFFSTTETC
jgi:hypothetical protein